jgi:hypothetical protein
MRKLTLVSLALVILTGSAFASIGSYDLADGRYEQVFNATPMNASRADTVYLIGGPNRDDGKFQDDLSGTQPEDEGWFGVDLTAKVPTWHVSTYRTGVNTAYCGDELIPSCGVGDPIGGYANSYWELLDWSGTAPNALAATVVDVTGTIWYDNEPGYDYTYFAVEETGGMMAYGTWNGIGDAEAIAVNVTVDPANYIGPGLDQIHVQFIGSSDGAWSDSDCDWPTQGHTNLDDIAISFNGTQVIFDDFESGLGANWAVVLPPSVGDFAKVWPRLGDADECKSNDSPQFGFIDDGLVVPGTGGTLGVGDATYGPGGWAVNLLGGLAGPDYHHQNEIWSPVLAYPVGAYDGADFDYDIYRHQILNNGLFYVWHVRSSLDDINWTAWADRNFVYYGGPDYLRVENEVTDLLEPGRMFAQLAVGTYELGYIWGFEGTDATPGPYVDNVSFRVYEFGGPGISTREIDIAQDNFPAIGTINYGDLAANDVRFDMARNIALEADMINLPGDSIVFDIVAVRTGSLLAGIPTLEYAMDRNPLYDPFRNAAYPAVGSVLGDSIFLETGALIADRYSFDLPDDDDFFFPGDVIHYYISASDDLGGTSTLPSDLAGFGVFPGELTYQPFVWNSSYIVRALPTMEDALGAQPAILLWNDFANRGGENEWQYAMNSLGYQEGVDYDYYYTNGPSSGVGNGLGGRATPSTLAGYETMLYTSGDLGSFTLSNGDFANDPGDDITLVNDWLELGNKNVLFTGDDLAADLQASGANGVSFVSTWLSVDYLGDDLRPVIGGQSAPLVLPLAGNTVGLTTEFIAYGGCPVFNDFDVVFPNGTCERIAEFADASGTGGVYGGYAAGVYNYGALFNSDVVYFPVDFMYWYNTDAAGNARAAALNEILLFFGHLGSSTPTNVPGAGTFTARNFPNPFNPSTKIEWTIPSVGDLSIKVYNVQGELVKTLVDEVVSETSGVKTWNGTNNNGGDVASGIYFYEVRSGNNVTVNKMALVK